jgi:hypothetical protein
MKTPTLITFALLQFVFIMDCYSQLIAEAGNDTTVCASDSPALTIGGDPTVSGGVPPYNYTWSGSFDYAGKTYTASFMLEDTTVANPTFKEGAIPDSVLLFVTVSDAEEHTSSDSIQIRLSRYTVCLGECRFEIHEGDSIQLGHCVTGGIPPLLFQWEPTETLSDRSVEAPWAKPSISTTYILQITDSNGCQIYSNCKVYVIPAGIDEKNQVQVLELRLDPSERILHVKILRDFMTYSTFELISLSGSTVVKKTVEADIFSINVQHLEQGLYVYRWRSGEERIASGKVLL